MPGQAIVNIRDKEWQCSVASTLNELSTGLSGMPSIPPGTGMLFVLPQEQIVTVTAEDMLFPLSVIFIGDNLQVTEVSCILAPGDSGTTGLPCRYFLEVNAGEADGIVPGDPVNIELSAAPIASTEIDWISPVVTIAGALMIGVMMGKMGKTMADAMLGKPKERLLLYGPRGERLPLTQHYSPGRYGKPKSEQERAVEHGRLFGPGELPPRGSRAKTEDERKLAHSLKYGTEELPERGKGMQPARHDVEIGTWAERDRIGIWITDKRTGKTAAEWWDEDAQEMFEQGWFKPGDIRHQTITGRAFEESVLDYAESVGILSGSGKYLAQTIKDAYYWTAVNKDTGEIVESFTPYTSSGRALRGGKAFVSRHWRDDKALVEVWRQPFRYSENLKREPVASELVTPDKSVAVIPTEPRRPRREDQLEFLPDSPEFLSYTIEDIGYREKIDSAFQAAIARARRLK